MGVGSLLCQLMAPLSLRLWTLQPALFRQWCLPPTGLVRFLGSGAQAVCRWVLVPTGLLSVSTHLWLWLRIYTESHKSALKHTHLCCTAQGEGAPKHVEAAFFITTIAQWEQF